MPEYKYVALDSNGDKIKRIITADNESDFHTILQDRKEFCIKVREINESRDIEISRNSLSKKELYILCSQFSSMLSFGLTIVQSINILYEQTDSKKLKDALLKIYEQVQVGISLSTAMKNLNGIFSNFLLSLVSVGEVSGSLDKVFKRLADSYEREIKFKNKLSSALAYPIILIIVSIVVVSILFNFVLPRIIDIIVDTNELPIITKVLLSFSNLFNNNLYLILILFSLLGIFIFLSKDIKIIKNFFSISQLETPFLGKLYKNYLASVFSRTISTLFSSGIPLIDSLDLTKNVLSNEIAKKKIDIIKSDIEKGQALSVAISKADIFPNLLVGMLCVGEETGELSAVLQKTADFYDSEADASIEKIIACIEPTMIIILGIIIGTILVGIMLPIYQTYQNIGI